MIDLTLFGKQSETDRLKQLHRDGRMPHALMLTGEKGIGKKMLARWCALLMMCENSADAPCMCCRSCTNIKNDDHPDVIFAKGEKYTADGIREIVQQTSLFPNDGDLRVIIFEDCDQMSETHQNILLKAIEEPSKYNRYIFTCENTASVLPTIKSRVVTIPMSEMSLPDCVSCLVAKGVSQHDATKYILRMGKNPGKILEIINDKKKIALQESAERIAQCIADENEYDTAREFSRYTDREEIFGILSSLYDIISRAVRPDSPDEGVTKSLKENLTLKKLYAVTQRIEELNALSEYNVNAKVFAAYCSSRLFEIIA